MMKKILLTAAMAAALGIPSAMAQAPDSSLDVAPEGAPLWLRDVKISPNGDLIAFTYKGDIWTVPVSGGEARQLTVRDTYESSPVWSPDGKKIAFASDRNGNNDIYVMDAKGGNPRRLTSNSAAEIPEGFSPDGKEVYYSAAIQAPASSVMYPSGRMTQLYAVDVETGKSRQVLATPAQMISFSPDGSQMLYQDVKGFEDEWRKHHTSSVTRDIWLYTPADGKHRNLTARAGEDRNPVLDAVTGTVYLLSERDGGTFNVYQFPLDNPSQAARITDFKTHPVRFLSRANNGTLAFTYDGEIYTMAGRAARGAAVPQKVNITLSTDDTARPARLTVRPSGGVVSPNGEMVAFLNRGDVFVTSVEYPTTVQVTRTPQAERHLSWGSDNRSLYYTSERSGRKNIYRARIARKDDPDFPNAVEFTEEAIFPEYDGKGTPTEYSHPTISPDGKKMAYVKDRNQLWIRDLASGTDRRITDGETYPGKDDGMSMEWSPDSRWLTMEIIPDMRDPYGDIGLVEVETGKVTNLTNTGYMEANPRFVLDGNAIIYFTEQYGLRAQASWGSQDDIMIVFLNREARDRFMLSEEDYALLKEQEKKAARKTDDTADKKKEKKGKKDDAAEKKDDSKNIVVELEGIEDRVMRLTPFSSSLSDAIVTGDGETLYFLCEVEDGYDLWKLPLRKREPKLAAKMGSAGASLQADKSGKQLFVIGRDMKKLDKGDKLTPIKVSATHDVDLAAEREAMFDYVAVEEGERFYNTDMHGIDWPAMTAAYRKFLPHINNNYDFAEMLSELLGELNVSHTGGRYRGAANSSSDRTASLGLLYDMNFQGDGLKVDEVLANGPFDKAASRIGKGAVITAVNGHVINAGTDLGDLFNNLAGKKTLVAFTTPSGEKVSEVVIPCSTAKISDLMYRRWIKQRAADVDRWSNGRLGYVHIESMNDDSFRPMYADLLGKYNNREGVVIDIRWNGGGRMHEDIEQLFTGQKYLTQVIRGKDVCDMPSRRWNKPSVMLVAEPCYSNAHGTPWVYQHMKIGKVVGMPVPGTMTSVNWVTLQDPSLIFGIPVIGYRTAEGNYLENTQLEPDLKVANTPEQIVAGEDAQLHEAVNLLLRQIDAAK
ncbi:MAG: DPP IV N-terminal domain-containing protein [Muribaculaceae bacterium]|nr:DPP IV N-terminal domain-containing protein [Muribaculaceae bacterium]